MEQLLKGDEEERNPEKASSQVLWFFAHIALALGSWIVLMLLGSALSPQGVSQLMILVLSIVVPLLVGYGFTYVRQNDMAPLVWLIGLIWLLIISLYVLDMPTAPNACFQCDATEKLTRTFFSWPSPSGLIDNDGPILGTWPAAALIGYSIGARFALKRARSK